MKRAVLLRDAAATGALETAGRGREARYRSYEHSDDDSTNFYRKHTENLLKRYMRTSMDMGRSPSVLGNLVFRGKSSHSRSRNLEDAVIFVHDVETCLQRLDRGARELVAKIALQEYTQHEVAEMAGMSVRSVMRRYAEALDRFTDILLDVELLVIPRY